MKRLLDGVSRAGHQQYKTHLRYVHDLLEKSPRFRAVFGLLVANTADFDVDGWVQNRVFSAKQTCHEWPASEGQRLRVLHRIAVVSATLENVNPVDVGRLLGYSSNLDHQVQAFTRHVLVPLVEYLQTCLGTESEILHHLERMRRQVEWFEQERLYEQFSVDPSKGEGLYDRRVREFLFSEGIDFPFSQPSGPSGKPDVVGRLDTKDPLVCEIKLYDARRYGVPYLQQGVGQAIRYAHDYGKASAHLVIFNLSDERLQLPSDEPADASPPRLLVEGVTVFMVVVQAKPLPSASRDRHRELREIPRGQLIAGM
ncbi:MAG: hypothetical protein ABSF69_17790 [Polyangiaceae bacterium]